jgi:hypothetical protein
LLWREQKAKVKESVVLRFDLFIKNVGAMNPGLAEALPLTPPLESLFFFLEALQGSQVLGVESMVRFHYMMRSRGQTSPQ